MFVIEYTGVPRERLWGPNVLSATPELWCLPIAFNRKRATAAKISASQEDPRPVYPPDYVFVIGLNSYLI